MKKLSNCFKILIKTLTSDVKVRPEQQNIYYFHNLLDPNKKQEYVNNLRIDDNFITEKEEESILNEILPYMKRLRYEYDHWDNAIHGYKETERLKWNDENTFILKKVRDYAFSKVEYLPHVHILDLAENGYIKPHIDSVRFCGDVIAGLSLLSDSVMRFVNEKDNVTIDVWLKRRSLYTMMGSIRYDFTHEILSNDKSFFDGEKINKKRRISVICRSVPKNL